MRETTRNLWIVLLKDEDYNKGNYTKSMDYILLKDEDYKGKYTKSMNYIVKRRGE